MAADMRRDVGQLLNVAKAAQLLDFVAISRPMVVLNDEGDRFVKASPAERKAIWRERALQLRLFRTAEEMLCRAGGPIDSELVLETVILNLPEENYEKAFATFVNWARYGDLFTFDDLTKQMNFGPDVPGRNGQAHATDTAHATGP